MNRISPAAIPFERPHVSPHDVSCACAQPNNLGQVFKGPRLSTKDQAMPRNELETLMMNQQRFAGGQLCAAILLSTYLYVFACSRAHAHVRCVPRVILAFAHFLSSALPRSLQTLEVSKLPWATGGLRSNLEPAATLECPHLPVLAICISLMQEIRGEQVLEGNSGIIQKPLNLEDRKGLRGLLIAKVPQTGVNICTCSQSYAQAQLCSCTHACMHDCARTHEQTQSALHFCSPNRSRTNVNIEAVPQSPLSLRAATASPDNVGAVNVNPLKKWSKRVVNVPTLQRRTAGGPAECQCSVVASPGWPSIASPSSAVPIESTSPMLALIMICARA